MSNRNEMAIGKVINFWFGPEGSPARTEGRKEWWVKDDGFDQQVRATLGELHEQASQGTLDGWGKDPWGALALIILLDQVPRNIFRKEPRSYATDAEAQAVTYGALEQGFDRELPELMRLFLYMPLEHSEDMDDQERCVELIGKLSDKRYLDYAIRHRDIIARFGRFPHRNDVLGRESTPGEIAFLKEPGSSF